MLEAFFMEFSVEKSRLQTSVERKIEELQLSVQQYVFSPDASGRSLCWLLLLRLAPTAKPGRALGRWCWWRRTQEPPAEP